MMYLGAGSGREKEQAGIGIFDKLDKLVVYLVTVLSLE